MEWNTEEHTPKICQDVGSCRRELCFSCPAAAFVSTHTTHAPISAWQSPHTWNIPTFPSFLFRWAQLSVLLHQTAPWASNSQHSQAVFQCKCTTPILATLVTVKSALFLILHIPKVPATQSVDAPVLLCASVFDFTEIPSFFFSQYCQVLPVTKLISADAAPLMPPTLSPCCQE